jgi:VanZ family protein
METVFRSLSFAAYAIGLVLAAVLSLTPNFHVHGGPGGDHMAHVFGYAAVSFCAVFAFSSLQGRAAALMIALSAGLIFELIQAILPGREAGFDDVLANVAGLTIGVVLGLLSLSAFRLLRLMAFRAG